ncbi:MAG: DUF896 domain-containing protein [Eubacteriales bacterium]|nr:DUF896 domain-containing protein [Eubacteriales bacterium]
MTKEKIGRINELYRKSQTGGGLTPEELSEQEALRREYIDAVKANLRGQLNNIDIKEPDGTVRNLGEEHKEKEQEG